MTVQEQLLSEIAAYLAARPMAETTFGRLSVGDGKFVGRLRAGKNITVGTVEKCRRWMAAHPVVGEQAA